MKRNARVPKGEKYWYLAGNLKVKSTVEKDTIHDKSEWFNRNYFHTEEEANQMLKKLRAVFRGADVIEMPSEEDIKRLYPVFIDNDEDAEFHEGMRVGVSNTIDYFKDKIVK